MEVVIHYCAPWNYEPRAVSLAAELRKVIGVEPKLVAGGNGNFDIIVDNKKVFSKFETGRFPDPGEITNKLQQKKWFFGASNLNSNGRYVGKVGWGDVSGLMGQANLTSSSCARNLLY